MKKGKITRIVNNVPKALKAAALTTATTAVILAGIAKPWEKPKVEHVNTYKYSVGINEIKSSNDYTILDIGDHEIKGYFKEEKIKKAQEKGSEVGIIISSHAETESDIYLDVEFVKKVISEYDINCGVYLDVSNMIENQNLAPHDILNLINIFTNKLAINKIFVGIAGTEKDISFLKEYDEQNVIKDDVLLLDCNKEINVEESVSSLIKNFGDGNYATNLNFKSSIDKKNENLKDSFVPDLEYVVKEGETLKDIASQYGLSQSDILNFNELKEKNIKPGKTIIIPSRQVINQSSIESNTIDDSLNKNGYIMGIDISRHNGAIDFEKLSGNIGYVILRVQSYGNKIDEKFNEYAKGCNENNIPIGVYCCNYVQHKDSDFENKVDTQISEFIKKIANQRIELPAYIDFEDWANDRGISQTKYAKSYTNEEVLYLLEQWKTNMENIGIKPGLYTCSNLYVKCKNAYEKVHGEGSLNKDFHIWVGGSFTQQSYKDNYDIDMYNNSENGLTSMIPSKSVTVPEYNETVDYSDIEMLQVSEAGKSSNIGISGKVDVDFCQVSDLENMLGIEIDNQAQSQNSDKHKEDIVKSYPAHEFKRKSKFTYDVDKFVEEKYGKWGFETIDAIAILYLITQLKKMYKDITNDFQTRKLEKNK